MKTRKILITEEIPQDDDLPSFITAVEVAIRNGNPLLVETYEGGEFLLKPVKIEVL